MSGGKALSRFHQPISVPGRRLLHHVPLPFVAKKVQGGGGKALNQEIPLIPFIDFLLSIVLFLLASFSASGELPVDKDVTLPSAQNTGALAEAPIIAVAGAAIMVDGVPAGNTRGILDANRLVKVDELMDALKARKALWGQIHPGKDAEFPGVVILQIDNKVPAIVVKSVFMTAAGSGFPRVSFMVRARGGE